MDRAAACSVRFQRSGVAFLLPLSLLLLFLLTFSSCGDPGASIQPGLAVGSSPGTIVLSVGSAPDYQLDITFTITDAVTSAVIYSYSSLLQSSPVSITVPVDARPLVATLSIMVHLVAAGALHVGTNSTAGTTLTDAGASFSFIGLPLFVVDVPSAPTVIIPVQAVAGSTTLTLSQAFPAGTYYLFRTQGVGARITRTGVGIEGNDFTFQETQTTTQTIVANL